MQKKHTIHLTVTSHILATLLHKPMVLVKASTEGYEIPSTSQKLTLEKSQEWIGNSSSYVNSVFAADVDGDGTQEIVTGGTTYSTIHSQLTIWSLDGSTLILEKSQEWNTISPSYRTINSIFVADVDGDGKKEIVTGGNIQDGNLPFPLNLCHSQLGIWDWIPIRQLIQSIV